MEYLVIIGAILQSFGAVIYIRDMFKGKAKPNRVSWLGWCVPPLVAVSAALSKGAGISVLPTFMAGFGPLLVFTFSFFVKNAYWKLTRVDYFCGAFSLLGIFLWAITQDATLAVIFSILGDASAGIPTIIKAWKHPETESLTLYVMSFIATITTFFVIKEANFTTLAFPVYLMLILSIFIFELLRKRPAFRFLNRA